MRLVSALLFVALTGSTTLADEAKPADPKPEVSKRKVPLRVVRMLPETQQVLLFDRNRGTHVVAEVGQNVDGYVVDEIDDDEVTLIAENGAEVILAAPDATWRRRAFAGKAGGKAGEPQPVDPYGDAMAASPAAAGASGSTPAASASTTANASAGSTPAAGGASAGSTAPAAAGASAGSTAPAAGAWAGSTPGASAGSTVPAAGASAGSTAAGASVGSTAHAAVGSTAHASGASAGSTAPTAAGSLVPASVGSTAPAATTSSGLAAGEGGVRVASASDKVPTAMPVDDAQPADPSANVDPGIAAFVDAVGAVPAPTTTPAAPSATSTTESVAASPAKADAKASKAADAKASKAAKQSDAAAALAAAATGSPAPTASAATSATVSSAGPSGTISAPTASASASAAATPTAPANAFAISRGEVDAALADFGATAVTFDARFVADGLRIDSIADGTILAKLGLRKGDVLTAVDNQPLRGFDDAATLYARAGTARGATLAIVRAGKPLTLRVTIR